MLDGLGNKASESVNTITAEIFTGADMKNILGQDKSAVSHPGSDLFVFSISASVSQELLLIDGCFFKQRCCGVCQWSMT